MTKNEWSWTRCCVCVHEEL